MSSTFGVIAPHPPIMVDAVGGVQVRRSHLHAGGDAGRGDESRRVRSRHGRHHVAARSRGRRRVRRRRLAGVLGSLAQFGDGTTYRFRGDPELAAAIVDLLNARRVPAALRSEVKGASAGVLDHGVLVPMSFLDPTGRWPLVILSLSFLPYAMHREVGEAVCEAAEHLGRRVAFVASGD